jgi:hypothetical protein
MNSSNHANDDFDVVFTGGGVSAFAFVINALDLDWTIETFDLNDNLLSSYTLASQSPGLTGYARRGYFGATESTAIQYFTVRSAGSDRAVIDDFSYVMVVPEPNTGVLLGLGLLTLAGSRFRAQSAAQAPVRSISDRWQTQICGNRVSVRFEGGLTRLSESDRSAAAERCY